MTWVNFLTLAALVLEVHSQKCGCGVPSQNIQGLQVNSALSPGYPCNQPSSQICQQPYLSQQPILSPQPITQTVCQTQPVITTLQSTCQSSPVVTATPVIATTIIDNTVSNALANAIQLLIVSNLIEKTMNCKCISPDIASILEYVTSDDDDCCDTDLPNICQCEPISYNYPITDVCQTFAPVVTNIAAPFQTIAPTVTNFAAPCQTLTSFAAPCQTLTSVQNCADLLNPLPQGPVAAEVYFPAAIPAQLTCNFGYTPANVPCVSVNVEPLQIFDTPAPNILNGFCF
ncbi:hypothetical protein K1T71_014252 [Dendrolimus kikuchii]|uniref:Uncharacterized protein n=1 Tax=Dendrolimus kikuchii TaxID=765133 RepID=A0ACC1CFG9_9NEOP|nr:hypothetical protein K1T71_014252 [Dendrolimus kikuchii]